MTPEERRAARHTLIEAAVDVIEPNVTNRTHAYNVWNNLATSEEFSRAIVTVHADRHVEDVEAGACEARDRAVNARVTLGRRLSVGRPSISAAQRADLDAIAEAAGAVDALLAEVDALHRQVAALMSVHTLR